jgi:6-phosphofructokinase 1
MKIGILTGGGDCPGLNAVIRSVVHSAINDYGMSVVGFKAGFEGVIMNNYLNLDRASVSGILPLGGTILGSSNKADPFKYPIPQKDGHVYLDRSTEVVATVERLGLDAMVVIGGDGTMAAATGLTDLGINMVGIPKSIDNDLYGTDQTFGFDTAVATATDAIDRLHTTAQSHDRAMIVEVMGRYTGWIALACGVAGGADVILLPEIPYELDVVCEKIRSRNRQGKSFSIVVVGEGAKPIGGDMVVSRMIETSPEAIRLGGIGKQLAAQIEGLTDIETRVTILGHIVRGGSPTAYDRQLATNLGREAVRLIANQQFGRLVVLKDNQYTSIAIADAAGKVRNVPVDSPLVKSARSLGISLGVADDYFNAAAGMEMADQPENSQETSVGC